MKSALSTFCIGLVCIGFASRLTQADTPRVFPEEKLPADVRLEKPRNLNDYFPFQKIASVEAWNERAAKLRRQVQVATGLWPLPTRTPLHATVHSPVDRDDYTVWRVSLESFPGHYVTGSLYRPKNKTGRLPAVLSPHGHWPNGRFHATEDAELKKQIASGAERFLAGGRHPVQARCVQLARMGCVVFQYDMDGYADSIQRAEHRHGVREQMSTAKDWGLNTPQAELHLQNLMGLQTWGSIRALDFLSGLEDVDPNRIAVTGASGGGTQTFILMAVDDRPAAAIPCVMVSTDMQGGCQCENASYLRIGAGNIDLAALTAPRPLGLTAADDWTVELETKGYPDLVELYSMLGHKDRFRAVFHTKFKHNYNEINRQFMTGFVNDFLKLGFEKPIVERDYVPLTKEEQSVWTTDHPAPMGDQVGEPHERALLRWWTEDSKKQIEKLREDDAAYAKVVGSAWDVLIGKRIEDLGNVQQEIVGELDFEGTRGALVRLTYEDGKRQLPAMALLPSANINQQAVLWLSNKGKAGLLDSDGQPISQVRELLDAGYAVLGVDLLSQGEFLSTSEKLTSTGLGPLGFKQNDEHVQPKGFFHGYNWSLFSQRVQDTLATLKAIEAGPLSPTKIHLVGLGKEAGPIALAAKVQAGLVVAKTAVATGGFRFESIERQDDPMFLPGAAKYDGVAGLKQLVGDAPLWFDDKASGKLGELVDWLKE
ncbi:MAG: acetylxylan esterase [Planctomycetes bacterium]|nr:acetylxylan esterase [Planctomycetota bacterium]